MPILTKQPKRIKYIKEDKVVQFQLIVATNLYHWRKWRGFSQTDLAKKATLTQSIISELENGDYNPSLEVLSKIATALNITPDLLTKRIVFWKMIETIDYILQKIKDVDVLKAMKLVFLIDYETHKKDGKKLLDLEYWRWHRGPFNKEIYQIEEFFSKEKEYYQPIQCSNYTVLEKKDIQKIEDIIKKFGDMSATELMKHTYTTCPMKGCTIGGEEKMGEKIF